MADDSRTQDYTSLIYKWNITVDNNSSYYYSYNQWPDRH